MTAQVLRLDAGGDWTEQLAAAAAALAGGEVVVLPTDTVYGLAAAARVPGATEALFRIKARPLRVALPVLVSDHDQASSVVSHAEWAASLTARFWPGPLTVVLPRHDRFTTDLGGDGATVAVRVPDHDFVRRLCRLAGPLATTSANLHRAEPCRSGREAAEQFGDSVAVVVDGGQCSGTPSTVVHVSGTGCTVLREGSVGAAELLAAHRGGQRRGTG